MTNIKSSSYAVQLDHRKSSVPHKIILYPRLITNRWRPYQEDHHECHSLDVFLSGQYHWPRNISSQGCSAVHPGQNDHCHHPFVRHHSDSPPRLRIHLGKQKERKRRSAGIASELRVPRSHRQGKQKFQICTVRPAILDRAADSNSMLRRRCPRSNPSSHLSRCAPRWGIFVASAPFLVPVLFDCFHAH